MCGGTGRTGVVPGCDYVMEVDVHPQVSVFEAPNSDQDGLLHEAVAIKNAVIGNRWKKTSYIDRGIVPELLELIKCDSASIQLRTEATVILGSLAKGSRENAIYILSAGSTPVLLKALHRETSATLVDACLRCLRTLASSWNDETAAATLYGETWVVPRLLDLISLVPRPGTVQSQSAECACAILTFGCRDKCQQLYLLERGIIPRLVPWLNQSCLRHLQLALDCLVKLCYQNRQVANELLTTSNGDVPLVQAMVPLLNRDKPTPIRIATAKWFTYMYRACAVEAENPTLRLKVLPTLIAMCKVERPVEERVSGATTLAYLIEIDQGLQASASMTERCISVLATYFSATAADGSLFTKEEKVALQCAALRAFAALGANDGDNRKKIIETGGVMEHIMSGLSAGSNYSLRLAAARCLHSLSRSVQQLRTIFQDHAVWQPLMGVLRDASEELLSIASSALCNLLLEFSPSKEPIIELGAIDLLARLTGSSSIALRLNGIWALMNMAFQADQKVKDEILKALGTRQLFCLLSDSNTSVLMKTLGLLRNLLSPKSHIDQIMNDHGMQIMQAVTLILEGDHVAEVKEQTLCILANIAHGDESKEFIMNNDDILKKILTYLMQHSCVSLQTAAAMCLSNLVWKEEEGARERQEKLKTLGAFRLLQILNDGMADAALLDQVKTALRQFLS